MSKTRRNFTAQFKADLVLELLKGEKSCRLHGKSVTWAQFAGR